MIKIEQLRNISQGVVTKSDDWYEKYFIRNND